MAKQRTQRTTTGASKTSSGSYKTVGKLADGVTILSPKAKPSHFTAREIKSTIRELRRNSRTGRFVEAEGKAASG